MSTTNNTDNEENYLTCPCVFCTLCRMNLQCCDVLIKMTKKDNKGNFDIGITFPDDYEGDDSKEMATQIARFGVGVYKNEKMKKHDKLKWERNYYACYVKCMKKNKNESWYKLCFHAELPETEDDSDVEVQDDENPSTPSVMD